MEIDPGLRVIPLLLLMLALDARAAFVPRRSESRTLDTRASAGVASTPHGEIAPLVGEPVVVAG